jgi:hypothetical protein
LFIKSLAKVKNFTPDWGKRRGKGEKNVPFFLFSTSATSLLFIKLLAIVELTLLILASGLTTPFLGGDKA